MIEYFLFVVLFIGVYITINDIRNGIIPNKSVLLLFAVALVFQFFSRPGLFAFFSAAVYSVLIAVMFWEMGIWPGGDAKLFIALSFFFPGFFYSSPNLMLNFLTNIFVPIGIFMIAIVFYRSDFGTVKNAFVSSLNPYRILMIATMLLGFVWFVSLPVKLLGFRVNYFVFLIILFIAFELLRKFFTAKMEFFFIGCAALRILLDYNTVYSIQFLHDFFSILFAFVFFRFFIVHLAFHAYTKSIPIKKLRAGMVPAEGIKKMGKKFGKEALLQASFIGYMSQKKKKYVHKVEVLDKKDIEKIKELHAKKRLSFNSLRVYMTQPFAGFVFLGFFITIMTSGENFLAVIFNI